MHAFLLVLLLAFATPLRAADAPLTLNFVNADIEGVVRAVAQATDRVVIVDPRVKGNLTLVTEAPVAPAEAIRLLLAALRLQGYAMLESGGVARIVPEADARTNAGPVGTGTAPPGRGDRMVTQVFRLQFESAANLVPIVRPLVSQNNPVNAYPANNTLVITDYAENLQRIARIIAAVDTGPAGEVEVLSMRHALAVDLAPIISRMLDEGLRGAGGSVEAGQRVTVLADARTNSLVVRASAPGRLAAARSLAEKLDAPTARPGNLHVVHLKNADATRLAQTLRALLAADPSIAALPATAATAQPVAQGTAAGATTASLAQPGALAPAPATAAGNGIVQADPATNSLLITAPEPVYRALRDIIDRLDSRRAQVFIESLIVEVTAERAAEFGVQWQSLSNPATTPNARAIGGTNFGGTGTNILGTAQNPGAVGTGLNIGVMKGQVTIPGIGTITNLGLLARALETQAKANILSTPNLLTLDNEEARIVIGQNVPFITGQYAQTGASATVAPFQTIERRDVGLTLRVRPQISEGGSVRLAIYQEVSSVVDRSASAGFITNKRSIESRVMVDDGQVVVLGGLVQDSVSDGTDQVPVLGDLPLVGGLFRYDTRKRSKTNLMVFLRPYVVAGTEGLDAYTLGRYDYIRAQNAAGQPRPHAVLPDVEVPALPPIAPRAPQQPAGEAPAVAPPEPRRP